MLVRRTELEPPRRLVEQRVDGTRKGTTEFVVEPDGSVGQVYLDSGPPLLVDAAINAARRWRYSPGTVDGRAVESSVDIGLVFQLP